MTSSYDFSAAYVVMILAGVALLAVAGAVTVAPSTSSTDPEAWCFWFAWGASGP
jgi:hypothetical protein